MAHEVIYKIPSELRPVTMDFTGVLPSTDATLSADSTVTVTKTGGATVTDFAVNKSLATLVVSCDLAGGTHGEDYRVAFNAKGATSLKIRTRILEVRVRTDTPSSVLN